MQEKEELQLLQLHVFLGPEDKNEFLYFNAWTAIFGICTIYQKTCEYSLLFYHDVDNHKTLKSHQETLLQHKTPLKHAPDRRIL